MQTVLRRFAKTVGNVTATISEETLGDKVSREIKFTRRAYDGGDVSSFCNEGDLAQLGMALWRVQEWLNDHPVDEVPDSDPAF